MSGHVRWGYLPSQEGSGSRSLVRSVVAASVAGFGAGLVIGWKWGR